MTIDRKPFEAAAAYTFFHTQAWIALLLAHFPHWQDKSTVMPLPDGRAVLLPLLETDRVGPWRWLEAMPFAFIGGPVAAHGDLAGRDLDALIAQLRRQAGWLAINLDPLDPLAEPGAFGSSPVTIHTHLLALERNFDAVHRRFSKTMRYDMRRAEREGVSARRAKHAADFAAYFDLMCRAAAERWALKEPPYPRALYDALAAAPPEVVSLWLADYQGQVIGGVLNIHYHPQRTLHWSSALNPAFVHLNPTKLLQREAIRESCERGSTIYNMGPSTGYDGQPLEGVRRAKEALGAAPQTYAIPIVMNPWAMRVRALRDKARAVLRR